MRIEKRSLNWNPRPSAWQELQARQEKAKAYSAQNEEIRAATSSLLSTVASDQSFELGNLAAKAAVKRIQDETKAKLAANARASADQSTKDTIWRNKPAPTSVKAGDITVDLTGDTIRLSDGSTLNVKTGQKTPAAAVDVVA